MASMSLGGKMVVRLLTCGTILERRQNRTSPLGLRLPVQDCRDGPQEFQYIKY